MLVKRSIRLFGHPTSVALEPEFWDALGQMASARGLSIDAMIQTIDAARADTGGNLTSAIRVGVLMHFRNQLADDDKQRSKRA